MTIDGKPVRLLLRGDYQQAARWIPYFAGICRSFSLLNETRYQQNAEMRGKAQVIGGNFYIIDITAGDDVLYYTLVTGDVDGSLNRFVVMAWPEANVQLERAPNDPKFASDHYGSGYLSRYELDLSIGYASFHATMARCGGQLLVFFSSSSVTPIVIRYRRVKSTAAAKPTFTWPISDATWATASCLYQDRILAVRPPVSLDEADNHGIFAMEYTGAVRVTALSLSGTALDSRTAVLATPLPYPRPSPYEFSSLNEVHVCRGKTVDDVQPTYWLVSRAHTDAAETMLDEDGDAILIPLTYRRRWKLTVQRRERDTPDELQCESAELAESWINPEPPEGYPYSLGHYIPFFEEIEGRVILTVGRLYTNVPYGVPDRDGGKDMKEGDKRVHIYDRYVFDAETLTLQLVEVDCGFARIIVRTKGGTRRAYVHSIAEATWAWVPDDNPNLTFRTYMKGDLRKAEMLESGFITPGEKVCDTGFYVKGDVGRLDWVEAQTGFCPEFED